MTTMTLERPSVSFVRFNANFIQEALGFAVRENFRLPLEDESAFLDFIHNTKEVIPELGDELEESWIHYCFHFSVPIQIKNQNPTKIVSDTFEDLL